MARRDIKLKEWGTSIDQVRTVSEKDATPPNGYLIPGATYRFRTDENGFICTGNAKNLDAPRVVVLGDSIVESVYVAEESRFCAVAERALRDNGIEAQILNGGVTGAQLLNVYNAFLNKIVPLRPKIAVVMCGMIDTENVTDPASFWTDFQQFSTLRIMPAPVMSWSEYSRNKGVREPDMADRTKILGLLAHTAKLFDISIVFAIPAHRLRSEADEFMMRAMTSQYFDRRSKLRYAINQNTREFAHAAGLPVFDFEKWFEGRFDIFYDGLHLNEVGSVEFGLVFADFLAPLLRHAAVDEPA